MSSEAQQAKAAGAAAWSSSQFAQAVEHFTAAINCGGDKEFLRTMYSNRSAAFLKLNKLEEALRDGIKCVETDGQWAKGHVRKGDALFALRRFTEAYNAYNSGLRVTPNDASLQEKAEMAMRAIRNDSSSSNADASSSASAAGDSAVIKYARLAIFVLGFVYLVPLLPGFISSGAYKLCALLYASIHVQGLLKRCGFPKLNSEYAMRVAQDPAVVRIFLGLMLVFAPRPYFFCLAPMLFSEGSHYAKEILEFGRTNATTIQSRVVPLLARLNPQIAQLNVATLFAPQYASKVAAQMNRIAATFEVYQGLFHVVELFLPTRNFIQLYLWWQYLKLRFMTDQQGHMKAAFRDVDNSLSGLMNHQYCPGMVRSVYGTIKSFLAKQVETPNPNAAQGSGGGLSSMLSKCTIM